MSPTPQDLSNDTTVSQIKSRVPVPLSCIKVDRLYLQSLLCMYVKTVVAHVMADSLMNKSQIFESASRGKCVYQK